MWDKSGNMYLKEKGFYREMCFFKNKTLFVNSWTDKF